MPPAKSKAAQDESRSESSTIREKQIAAAAHARSARAKNLANSTALREMALANDLAAMAAPATTGMQWTSEALPLLDNYRTTHHLNHPSAFKSIQNQCLLTNAGLGRQSPTMARRKEKRKVSKEQLALTVRKNFNAAAVNEIDVMVELVYKVRNQDKAFRMRSLPTKVTK